LFLIEISGFDILLSFIYSIVLIIFARQVKKRYTNSITKRYFIPFMGFKILSAVAFALLHAYIYKGGDTFLYFAGTEFISNQMLHAAGDFYQYLFADNRAILNLPLYGELKVINSFSDPSTLLMSQISSIFYLLSFKQFLATTILLSVFSAFGIWALFSTFSNIYPRATQAFAVGILFYPTIGIWGSGILKDTITLAAIGWMFSSFYSLSLRQNMIKSGLTILFAASLCLKLKPYILYTFLPAMLLWMQSNISGSIQNKMKRYFIAPIIIFSFGLSGYFFMTTVSENAGKYSLENVQGIAEGFQNWHTYLAETQNQSGYSLGEVSFTPLGILQKSPEALFVTYFRPTPFEIRNFATAFESFQSTILLLLTLYVFIKSGPLRSIRLILFNGHIRAFMVFSLLLGVAVGITSYNFGALSRYKIPCLPFYTAALAMIYYEGVRLKNKRSTSDYSP